MSNLGAGVELPHSAHTSCTRWRPSSTSYAVRKVGEVTKTYIHVEHDGVPVELHEDLVEQLHHPDCGARDHQGNAVTGRM